jgi:hypothetical protein
MGIVAQIDRRRKYSEEMVCLTQLADELTHRIVEGV